MEVLVEFDYIAQNIDELDIKKGDRLCSVIRKEEGWYEGILIKNGKIGKKGLFPDNFVKQIKSSPSIQKNIPHQVSVNKTNIQNIKLQKNLPTSSPTPPPPPSNLIHLHQQQQQQQQQQQKQNIHNNPKSEKSPHLNNNEKISFMYKARVLYSYIPVNEDELAIQENEIVQVIRLVEDGWYEGMCSGKQGVFPSNYVEQIPNEQNSNPDITENINEISYNNDNSEKDDKKTNNNSKKVFGIGFGNIFSGKTIELKTKENFTNQNNSLAADLNQRQSDRLNERQIADSIQYPDETKEKIKARVLYEYVPTQPDELHLVIGDFICILDKNLEDEGWFRGQSISTGEIGVFPDNFVEETTESDLINTDNIQKKIIKDNSSNESKNNRTNSMTNSTISNSSSNNSLSKSVSKPISKITIQQNVVSELNHSKSHSDLSDDLEELNNQSESNKLIHIKKVKQLNKRPPSFRKKKSNEKDDNETSLRNSPKIDSKQEDNIIEDLKSQEADSAISSKSVIISEPITAISSHNQSSHTPVLSKQASFSNAGTNSDLSVTTAVTTLDSPTQLSLAEDISFLKQELIAVRSENKLIRNELNSTKTQHENQLKKMNRNFTDLINEIDEEKKTRLALQVELERLKKTIEVNNIFIG